VVNHAITWIDASQKIALNHLSWHDWVNSS